MTDLNKLAAAEARRWAAMHIDPKRKGEFVAVAKRLVAPAAKARYLTIQARTGVPWWFTAVVHEREAGQRFDRQLGQGDALNRVSTHVPKGRGPFKSFEDGAVDALVNCAPYAARQRDWRIGPALTMLEQYNGLGYAAKGVPSPYDWSGTDQYRSGKYVADHVYSASAVDRQLGCAALLATMAELDPDVHFDGASAPVPAKPVGSTAPKSTPAATTAAVKKVTTATTSTAAVSVGMSAGAKVALVVVAILVVAGAAYLGYRYYKNRKEAKAAALAGPDAALPTVQ